MGGRVVRVGGKGACPDPVVTSCHVNVAMGLAAPLLRNGAWSGLKHGPLGLFVLLWVPDRCV